MVGIAHGVDEIEDGALIGGQELGDAREVFQESRGLGAQPLCRRGESEQFVGRHLERAGGIDEEGARRLGTFHFVVRNHAHVLARTRARAHLHAHESPSALETAPQGPTTKSTTG